MYPLPLHIFFCLLNRCLLQIQSVGGSCSVHYYGRLGAVSVVCVWAGVGEALRWNWRHNDSLSPDPQTLARSSHSRGLFYLIGLIKLMLFQVVNTDYEILDICWIRFLVASACWELRNDIFIKRLSLFQRFTLSWNYCMIQTEETRDRSRPFFILFGWCRGLFSDGETLIFAKVRLQLYCPLLCSSGGLFIVPWLYWTPLLAKDCPCLVTLVHGWPFPPRQDVPRPSPRTPHLHRTLVLTPKQRILLQVSLLKLYH